MEQNVRVDSEQEGVEVIKNTGHAVRKLSIFVREFHGKKTKTKQVVCGSGVITDVINTEFSYVIYQTTGTSAQNLCGPLL